MRLRKNRAAALTYEKTHQGDALYLTDVPYLFKNSAVIF